MGQAKQRGTYEERRAAALERDLARAERALQEREQERRRDQEWLDSLSPEEYSRELRRRRNARMTLALAAGIGMGVIGGIK